MRVHIVARPATHQDTWGRSFANGLRRQGINATISDFPKPCDLLVLWGVRKQDAIAKQKALGGEVCVLERGYVGDRFEWTSVSFGGGLNNRGMFSGPFEDASRWQKLFPDAMKPWRMPEGYALLIGQVPNDMSVQHVRIADWYNATAKQLRLAGWDVRFREHPQAARRGIRHKIPEAPTIDGSLENAISGAGLVVTFNSNTGVESVLSGCPTVTMDEGAMAWPVASHDIGKVVMPDRSAWAAALAWKQYRIEEIESGFCWDMVKPCMLAA